MDYLECHDIRLVIFDLDGTLVDSDVAISYCFNEAMGEMGYPPQPVSRIAKLIGLPLQEIFESFLDSKEAFEAVTRYRTHYHTVCMEKTVLQQGAVEFLDFLRRRGIQTAVATNKPEGFTKKILQTVNILNGLDWVVGPESVERAKPDPQMIRLIMERVKVDPARTLYVGDSLTDCVAARAAGVRMLAITTGAHTRDELAVMQPEWLGDSLHELKFFLEQEREGS